MQEIYKIMKKQAAIDKISNKLIACGLTAPFRISSIKKIASVTFWLPHDDSEIGPMNISDIIYKIKEFFYKKNMKIGHDQIKADGDDYFEFTGVINVYFTYREDGDDLSIDTIKPIINEFIEKSAHVFTISEGQTEISGSSGLPVVRYNVTENKTQELEQAPELNVSNANAYALIKLLQQNGLDIEGEYYSGAIQINELKTVFDAINNNPTSVAEEKREKEESVGESGAKMYDGGLPESQIWGYLTELQKIVNFAEEKGYTEINFG